MLGFRHRPILSLCRSPIRRTQQEFRKFSSSSTATTSSSRNYSPLLVCGVLAASSTVAAYFFWPDTSRSAPTHIHAHLSPAHFTPVILTGSKSCPDPETRLITLTVPPQSVPARNETVFGPIWSVFIKDDDIQVERPYTPLKGIDSEGRMDFWVKRYPKGEVGRWLHSKRVGDTIEIRGPVQTWRWQEEKWDEIVMISGGTGITPFCQLLHHSILNDPTTPSRPRFVLLHSSRKPTELPPADMLEPVLSAAQQHPENLSVSLFVDSLDGPQHPLVASSTLQVGRINKTAIERAVGLDNDHWWNHLFRIGSRKDTQKENGKKILFLVCGPDPLIAAIAGPLGRNFSQGNLGGVLGSMGYGKDQVWKL